MSESPKIRIKAPFSLRVSIRHHNSLTVQYWVFVLLAVYEAATTAASREFSFLSDPYRASYQLTPKFQAIWGWYADRHASRRIPFLLGLVAIADATLIMWLSRQIALQVIGRIFLGLASAIVWVTGLAMIADSVEEDKIGQCVGYLGTAMMIGM